MPADTPTADPKWSRRLQELDPSRPERPLPHWLGPAAAFLTGVLATVAVIAATGVFDTGPSQAAADAAATARYDEGFADGARQTRQDIESEFQDRTDVLVDAARREARERATTAAGAQVLEQLGRSFDDGYRAGYGQGYRQAKFDLAADAAPSAAVDAADVAANAEDSG